ncbi:MAG: hypothetical protein V4636_01035 [Pseudomonadota bacterium]
MGKDISGANHLIERMLDWTLRAPRKAIVAAAKRMVGKGLLKA